MCVIFSLWALYMTYSYATSSWSYDQQTVMWHSHDTYTCWHCFWKIHITHCTVAALTSCHSSFLSCDSATISGDSCPIFVDGTEWGKQSWRANADHSKVPCAWHKLFCGHAPFHSETGAESWLHSWHSSDRYGTHSDRMCIVFCLNGGNESDLKLMHGRSLRVVSYSS